MSSQTINISLPKALLKKVDIAAKAEYATRSDFIRQALVGRLRGQLVRPSLVTESDWNELLAIADEIEQKTVARGLTTDEAIVRAVKETRRTVSRQS